MTKILVWVKIDGESKWVANLYELIERNCAIFSSDGVRCGVKPCGTLKVRLLALNQRNANGVYLLPTIMHLTETFMNKHCIGSKKHVQLFWLNKLSMFQQPHSPGSKNVFLRLQDLWGIFLGFHSVDCETKSLAELQDLLPELVIRPTRRAWISGRAPREVLPWRTD